MDFLRRAAKTWAAKFLLGLLVLSFVGFGVAGTAFSPQDRYVVSVGDTHVGPVEFSLAYNRQLSVLSQRLGTRLTTDQARAFGVENQVFSQLSAGAALDQQSSNMNLGLSDARLANLVAEDPAFRNFSGNFDRATFRAVLNSVGMTETDYLENRSNVAVRAQIVEAVADGYKVPDVLLKALAEYDAETRDIDYIFLDKSHIDPIAAPTDAEIETFFTDNQAQYRAPEYRKVSYVMLRAEDIVAPDDVSEDEIKQDYEARISNYTTPERRTIDQLVFSSREDADAAKAKLDGGMSFEALASEQGKQASDYNLGTFTKALMPDQKLTDAAFSLSQDGDVSDVVDGTFGPVILRVSKIEPENVQSFDEVKDTIRQELALVAANDILLDVHDAYEDNRAGGMTLVEAAEKENLTPVTVERVDRAQRDENGDALRDLPRVPSFISQVFDTDVGVESSPISLQSGGFLWFEVLDIIPDRDRTLDEVRDEVIEAWTNAQTEDALSVKAGEIKDRLDNGADLNTVAEELGIAVTQKFALKRNDSDATFGESALMAAFSGPQGYLNVAKDASGENQIILMVKNVTVPETATIDSISEQNLANLQGRSEDDILEQLVQKLQTEFGVSVNPTLAAQVLSGTFGGHGGGH